MSDVTKYEVAVMKGSDVVLALGYTARHTKEALYRFLFANGKAVARVTGYKNGQSELHWNKKFGWIDLSTGHTVRFTGYTIKHPRG